MIINDLSLQSVKFQNNYEAFFIAELTFFSQVRMTLHCLTIRIRVIKCVQKRIIVIYIKTIKNATCNE